MLGLWRFGSLGRLPNVRARVHFLAFLLRLFSFLLHLFVPCHTGLLVGNCLSTLLSRLGGGGFGFVGCLAGVFDPPSPFFSFVFLPVLQKMGERGLRRYILG